MSEKEKATLEVIKKAIPLMSDEQKGRIVGYGEAILDMRDEVAKKKKMAEGKETVEAK